MAKYKLYVVDAVAVDAGGTKLLIDTIPVGKSAVVVSYSLVYTTGGGGGKMDLVKAGTGGTAKVFRSGTANNVFADRVNIPLRAGDLVRWTIATTASAGSQADLSIGVVELEPGER